MNRTAKIVIGIAATALSLWIISIFFSFKSFYGAVSQVSVPLLLLALLIYSVSWLFRSLRIRHILKIGLQDSMKVIAVNNCLNNLLPYRLGELGYIYLLKRRGVALVRNISSLLVTRYYDILANQIIFTACMLFLYLSGVLIKYEWKIAIIVFSILILLQITLGAFSRNIKEIAVMLTGKSQRKFMVKVRDFLAELAAQTHMGNAGAVLGYSIIIWLALGGSNYALLEGLNIHLPIVSVVFIFILPLFLQLLPIQTLGAVGSYEAGVMAGVYFIGVTGAVSLEAVLAVHIITILFAVILCCISFLIPYTKRNTRDLPSEPV